MSNLLVLLFVLLNNLVLPPDNSVKRHFVETIKKYNLVYSHPKGYKFIKPQNEYLEIGDSLSFSNVLFTESKDKKVLIGFYFQKLDTSNQVETDSPSLAFAKKIVWMDIDRYNRNLGREKPRIHPYNQTSMLNASISGEYGLRMQNPFLGRYSNCKMRFFEKFDQLLVFVFYLYQPDHEKTVEKIMEDTFDILKFGKK